MKRREEGGRKGGKEERASKRESERKEASVVYMCLTRGAVGKAYLPLQTAHYHNMPSSLLHHGREQS